VFNLLPDSFSDDIFLNGLSDDELEYFQERAAIYQYDGGLSKKEAEKLAYTQSTRKT
jgi:hypothetical protein